MKWTSENRSHFRLSLNTVSNLAFELIHMTPEQLTDYLEKESEHVMFIKARAQEMIEFAENLDEIEDKEIDEQFRILPQKMMEISIELFDGKLSAAEYKEKENAIFEKYWHRD